MLRETATRLQESLFENSDEQKRSFQEHARISQDAIKAKEIAESYERHFEFLLSKHSEIENELKLREEAMEKLTLHLGKTIEGQHSILEEKEQCLSLLDSAVEEEQKLEDEVKDLKVAILALEEKLIDMDIEMNTIQIKMEKVKTFTTNKPKLERETKELRKRVHKLEEEIMEKEGQITILTSSFP
jgi:chromosome segregation ATPase